MSDCPIRTSETPRGRLLRLCLRFPLLLVVGQPGALHGQQAPRAPAAKVVSVRVKVCVSDETGKRPDLKPLLLNSTTNRPEVINQKTEDDCYRSNSIALSTGQPYFVAAVTGDRTAFQRFTVADTDEEKNLDLTFTRQGGASTARIEICAENADGKRIQITSVKPTSSQAQVSGETPKDPECYRVSAAAADEYLLSLTAPSAERGGGGTPTPAGWLDVLLLAIAGASLLFTFVLLKRFSDFALTAATRMNISPLYQRLEELLNRTQRIGEKVERLAPAATASPAVVKEYAGAAYDGSFDGSGARTEHVSAAPADVRPAAHAAPEPEPAAETAATQHRHHLDDAKMRYSRFSGGEAVEHFYLMPSGSSSASNLVEDAKVELREQNNGTYVAFRSSVNENEAWVFPMPNMFFSPETFKAVFPALTAQDYESGNIEPKRVVAIQPKLWKTR